MMKLLAIFGILLATVACGGLSEIEVDERISAAGGTAIAEIPAPTVVPTPVLTSDHVILFTAIDDSTYELTFDDLLVGIRGANGRINTLVSSLGGGASDDGIVDRLDDLERCAGALDDALSDLARNIQFELFVTSPSTFGCSGY